METMLKIVNLNIEGDSHLSKVIPFLQKTSTDVICLEEVFKLDVPLFESALKMVGIFVPTVNILKSNIYNISTRGLMGSLVLTKLPLVDQKATFYLASANKIPVFISGRPNSLGRALNQVRVNKDGQLFNIVVTHFYWSRGGESTKTQLKYLTKMFSFIDFKDIIFCGDFNAPRGRQTWSEIAARLKDNIPANISSTIDPKLHRAGNLQLVVDGIFTSPNYIMNKVQVISGVSDHCAIVGEVTRLNI